MRNLKPIYSQTDRNANDKLAKLGRDDELGKHSKGRSTEDRKDRNANEKLAKLGRDDELGKLKEGRKADDEIAKHSKGRSPEDTTDRKADDELAKLEYGDSEPAPSVTSTKFKRLTRGRYDTGMLDSGNGTPKRQKQ
jgi:hypothetical protein